MFVDIHSHILPGLDDGAATLPDSIQMVQKARTDGTIEIVATPHANRLYSYDRATVADKADELDYESGSPLRIHTGCELFLDANWIAKAIENPPNFTIGTTNYILVEFGDWLPGDPVQIFRTLRGANLRPILAHPERQPMLTGRSSVIADFIREGVLIQVTAGSILGGMSSRAKRAAEDLMRQGLVHVVASDTHNLTSRPPFLSEAYRAVCEANGEAYAQQLFVTNPRVIVNGEDVPAAMRPDVRRKRTWWQFAARAAV